MRVVWNHYRENKKVANKNKKTCEVPVKNKKKHVKCLDSPVFTGYNQKACEIKHIFFACQKIIATARPHVKHGEINREVKWNANIQPVSKKGPSDSC